MARRRADRAGDPAGRDTATLRQRESESTAPRMVDGGDVLAGRIARNAPPEAVVVTHAAAPAFAWRYRDAVTLSLRPSDVPAALSWPSLSGLLVDAVTAGMVARAARSLVAVLLHAGAETVRVFDVVDGEPVCIDTHAGVVR